ncbi:MAG: 6-phosphogluconolactonase [Desulfomonile tiedjei]|nr:6-phosphogluconolactonase [Desulfomonile tiedjei]
MKSIETDRGVVRVYSGEETLSRAAADLFEKTAHRAVDLRDGFAVVLSGGHSPERAYRLLAEHIYRERVPWDKIDVFWGDERCVARDDPRNNARMAFDRLLGHVPIPEIRLHPIPVEEPPEQAADRYEELLRNFFQGRPPSFDLVLLGLGENGHTASLFPGTPILEEHSRWVKEVYVPEQHMYRVSLTVPIINQASTVAFLVHGPSKSRVLREVVKGPLRPRDLPAQLIVPADGELLWLVDAEAAREL